MRKGRSRVLGPPSDPPTPGEDTRHPASPHEHIPASVIPGRPHQCPCYKMCSGGGREHGRPRGEGTPPRPPPGRSSPHQSKRLHPVSCYFPFFFSPNSSLRCIVWISTGKLNGERTLGGKQLCSLYKNRPFKCLNPERQSRRTYCSPVAVSCPDETCPPRGHVIKRTWS